MPAFAGPGATPKAPERISSSTSTASYVSRAASAGSTRVEKCVSIVHATHHRSRGRAITMTRPGGRTDLKCASSSWAAGTRAV